MNIIIAYSDELTKRFSCFHVFFIYFSDPIRFFPSTINATDGHKLKSLKQFFLIYFDLQNFIISARRSKKKILSLGKNTQESINYVNNI